MVVRNGKSSATSGAARQTPNAAAVKNEALASQPQAPIDLSGRSADVISVYLRELKTGFVIRLIMAPILVATVCVSLLSGDTEKAPSTHRITFTFDYDFRVTLACSTKVTRECVQQFNFYDISAGIPKRVKLGSISVPAGASGFVKSISATTDPLLFNSGRHRLAVSAQMPNGLESDLSKCTTIVKVP
jgi:hypothetical protein